MILQLLLSSPATPANTGCFRGLAVLVSGSLCLHPQPVKLLLLLLMAACLIQPLLLCLLVLHALLMELCL